MMLMKIIMMMMIHKTCQLYATSFHTHKKLFFTAIIQRQISVELCMSGTCPSCLVHSPSCITLHKCNCMKVTHL
jgi:hypothetical protein